ncbi:hypothetical protein Hanom_Chr08g00746501 [Helianthus anomalus]
MELSSKVIFILCRKTMIRMKMMLCSEIGISPKQMGDCMHEGGSKEAIKTPLTT